MSFDMEKDVERSKLKTYDFSDYENLDLGQLNNMRNKKYPKYEVASEFDVASGIAEVLQAPRRCTFGTWSGVWIHGLLQVARGLLSR